MVNVILVRALVVFTCAVVVHTQAAPEHFGQGEGPEHGGGPEPEPSEKGDDLLRGESREPERQDTFDLSKIPFGMSCTPGMPMGGGMMGDMPGDGSMPGGSNPNPSMTDGSFGDRPIPGGGPMPAGERPGGHEGPMHGNGSMPGVGSMPGRGWSSEGPSDSMRGHGAPCIRCGCVSDDDDEDEHHVRCRLTPGGEMCYRLQEFKEKLIASCEPGDLMEETAENPCGCMCTMEGKWECWSNQNENDMPNSHCLFMINHRFIDLAPNRVHDVSVLYPQHCKQGDKITIMGQYEVYENCKICLCVDGLWQCVQKENGLCDDNGMPDADVVACSDRSGSYPLGTYTQDGPTYRMCVFGRWQDAKFAAAIPKPGRCTSMEKMMMEMMMGMMMGDMTTCNPGNSVMHQCVHDIDCEGQMKCCFSPCGGGVCTEPDMQDMDKEPHYGNMEGPMGGDDDHYEDMMKEHMPEPCQLQYGEWIPHGQVQATGYCETCVCVNGDLKCYNDLQCNRPPTCACSPPGTDDDMTATPGQEFPFGYLWNVTECTQCVCLSGEWECHQKKMCKPKRAQPKPCTVSETHNMTVPTGQMSENGCCVCMNGIWSCDSPDCNSDEMYHANDCLDMNGNVKSRHGSYKMKDKCLLCMCIDGEYQCKDICDYDHTRKDKGGPGGMGGGPGGMSGGHGGMSGGQGGMSGGHGGPGEMMSGPKCSKDMFHCPITQERMDMCDSNMECPHHGSMCCSNGCFKNCTEHSPGCPPGVPMARCMADPCTVNKCAASPNATCRANYCGGCNAEFFNSEDQQINCTTGHVIPMECPKSWCEDDGECEDDGDCDMGAICCRASHGCIGKCVVQKQPQHHSKEMPKEGVCPFKNPPPRFDNIPFPWDDMKMMMSRGMGGSMGGRPGGMGGGMDGGMGGGMGGGHEGSGGMGGGPGGMGGGMDGGMGGGMGGGPGGMDADMFASILAAMMGGMGGGMSGGMGGDGSGGMGGGPGGTGGGMEAMMGSMMEGMMGGMMGDMSGGMNRSIGDKWDRLAHLMGNSSDMNNPLQQWLHGECNIDSQCDGQMKCCGSFYKTCMTPIEQPHPKPCMDSMGSQREHGYYTIGERHEDLDFCLVCMCFDGEWLCKKLTCTAESPKPMLAECDGHGDSMGQMVPTGSTGLYECKAMACFNGHWLWNYLKQCKEWKEGNEGQCPRMEPRMPKECPEHREPQCHIDADCEQDTQKCCFDGCTMACVDPIEKHHGSCPKPSLMDIMMHGSCEEGMEDECDTDEDCLEDMNKCCFNGCHKSCQMKEDKYKKTGCIDPSHPYEPMYGPGQIIKKGDCDICVCAGMEWMCSAVKGCNAHAPYIPCKVGDKRAVPSGTYHAQRCVQSVCLNGEWKSKVDPDCCPEEHYYCMANGEKIPSGRITWDLNSCHACICMDGFQTCKQFDSDACSHGEVPMPKCWHGDMEFDTGSVLPISKKDKKCVCFFGQWRCAAWSDMDEELDLKRGECPAIFHFFEEMEDDDTKGRRRGGMWDDRGIPMEQRGGGMHGSDGGVLSFLRDWLMPPHLGMDGESEFMDTPAGGMGGEDHGERRPGMSDGDRTGEEWPMSGDGGRGDGGRGDGGRGDGGRGDGHMPGGGDPDGWAPSSGGGGPPRPGGQGQGERPGPGGGGQGGDGAPPGRGDYSGDMARGDRQDGHKPMTGDTMMPSIMELVHFLQKTRFDGCQMDEDCHGNKICCGAQIGGTCIEPKPAESLPLPCEFNDEYFSHGSIRRDEMMGECQACACVHGMWQCEDLSCDKYKEELKNCSVGPEESGLKVPSGAQQTLQCELCVCLSGDWKCSDRACSNDNTDAMCPVHMPPNVYPAGNRCRGNKDCGRGDKCCGYKNYGRVCVPMKMPNLKNGECPVKIEKPCSELKECMADHNCHGMMKCCRHRDVQSRCRRLGPGKGVCVKPSGDHCPGGAMSYTPCGDVDPCEHVGNCASDSTLTCMKQECGSCQAMHYDMRMRPVDCQALSGITCQVPGRKSTIPVGESADDPRDPCQLCVCQDDGHLSCTKHRKCGKHRRFKMTFKSDDCSALDEEKTKRHLIGEIRALIAAVANIPARAIKAIDVECGSFITEMSIVEKPSGEDSEEPIDVDGAIEDLQQEVNSGQLVLIFDGENHASLRDSFEGVRTHSDEYHYVLILAPIIGFIVVALIIAFTVCFIKSKSHTDDQENALPMKA